MAILGATLLAAVPAEAQLGRRQQGTLPAGPEELLRLRERLELSADQVRRLQSLRDEALAARIAITTEMLQLRSKLRAGELTPEQAREQIRAQRETLRTRLEALRPQRAREVLTDAQRQRLAELRREAFRAGMRAELRSRLQARRPGWRFERFHDPWHGRWGSRHRPRPHR
jgi:hypothetical protein